MAEHDIDTAVHPAQTMAVALLDLGWKLRKLHYSPATGAATLVVHTPTRRALTITSADHSPRPPVVGAPVVGLSLAVQFADAVAELGRRGGDALGDLTWLLAENVGSTAAIPLRRDAIPDPALRRQTLTLRTAFWLLSELVCTHRWDVTHIGEEIAGGGFIAAIPGDVTAIFPASIPADGTPGAALAASIPRLDPVGLDYLRHINPWALTRAHTDPAS